jgi:hypothetical protein
VLVYVLLIAKNGAYMIAEVKNKLWKKNWLMREFN